MDESKALNLIANVITIAAAVYALVTLITGGGGGCTCKSKGGFRPPNAAPSCRGARPRGPSYDA